MIMAFFAGIFVTALVMGYFSAYQHVVRCLVAGMLFWFSIEALRWTVQYGFDLEITSAYFFAMSLSTLAIWAVLIYDEHHVDQSQTDLDLHLEKPTLYDDGSELSHCVEKS